MVDLGSWRKMGKKSGAFQQPEIAPNQKRMGLHGLTKIEFDPTTRGSE